MNVEIYLQIGDVKVFNNVLAPHALDSLANKSIWDSFEGILDGMQLSVSLSSWLKL